MTKEDIVNIIMEKYYEISIYKFDSYRILRRYDRLRDKLTDQLNEEQNKQFEKLYEIYEDFIMEKEHELATFIFDFLAAFRLN